MENRGKSTKGFNCFKPPAVTGDDVACAEERKTKGRRRSTLHGAFKAVLSKASLMKKTRSENSSKSNNHHPKEKSSYKYDHKEIIGRSSSDDSSIYSSYSRDTPSTSASSSRSSFMSTSNAVSEPEQLKQSMSHDNSHTKHRKVIKGRKINRMDHITKRNSMDYYTPKIEALCIVMVCLAALVFCNKGYAIATCTLIWLVLVMGRCQPKKTLQRSYSSEENDLHIDSKEYKKKVIMQGLLERNRPG